ncbi:MAG: hypothetical protein CMG54_02450 [Candidatus Marinimicrobia bacterium]|nr:hypothetical protein [Candidatus Neomarinimicrobiota bacterium]|tara:strand:- start:1476 stop:1916 length:441 start_codon:yes stop_codon:yes gene_type:complete
MNKNYNQLISKYIDNELSSDEKKSFEDYMKSNDDFANKVNKIKNNILLFKNISKFETSKDFIQNLNEQISKKQSNLFSFLPDFKTSLSFAFSLALLFFIMINYGEKDSNYIAKQSKSEQNLLESKIDSLKSDDFQIKQVKGSKINK